MNTRKKGVTVSAEKARTLPLLSTNVCFKVIVTPDAVGVGPFSCLISKITQPGFKFQYCVAPRLQLQEGKIGITPPSFAGYGEDKCLRN